MLILASVWLSSEQLLVALDQPQYIAALTAQFMWWCLPALPFLVLRETLQAYGRLHWGAVLRNSVNTVCI